MADEDEFEFTCCARIVIPQRRSTLHVITGILGHTSIAHELTMDGWRRNTKSLSSEQNSVANENGGKPRSRTNQEESTVRCHKVEWMRLKEMYNENVGGDGQEPKLSMIPQDSITGKSIAGPIQCLCEQGECKQQQRSVRERW